jgi:signal transduction histidine kinase
VRRGWAAVAWLRRPTGQPSRLTLWGWAADAILALLLTVGTVSSVLQRDVAAPSLPPVPRVAEPGFVPDPGTIPVPPSVLLPPVAGPHIAWWLVALAALTALPLVTRRRFPLASFWIIAVAAPLVYAELADSGRIWMVVASVVAAYSAPMYSRYRNLAVASVVVSALWVLTGDRDDLPSGLLTYLLLAAVGLAANAIHTWRQRARTLQREQETSTRLAVDRERARLARELHDVVSHNVSMMVIQAGAARKVMDTSPDLARDALLAVEAGGRAAMTELRQVLSLLRVDSDTADLTPQPGLDRLPELVDRVRETGVPVTLMVTGTFDSLPPGVDLAAYRVVQETLTNAVRHAAGATVTVEVTGTAEELRVDVADTGGLAAAPGSGSGRGLAGLRERLSVYGGTLTAGRRPTGGYRVVAAIPLRGAL